MVVTIAVWLCAFFLTIAILFLILYQSMCLTDLELDYVNPYDSASRINSMIMSEFVLQGILCLLFLLSGHWIMFLLGLPVLCYNVRMYQQGQHLVEVTEIFNQLSREKQRRFIKLIYHVALLFLVLLWMVLTVLADDL